jgi:hypothetical protein
MNKRNESVTQPPAAGEAAHTPATLYHRDDPFEGNLTGTWHIDLCSQGFPVARVEGRWRKEALDRATFMARACNNHVQLVAALEANTRLLSLVAPLLRDGPHGNKEQFVVAQIENNRATLAKANGSNP